MKKRILAAIEVRGKIIESNLASLFPDAEEIEIYNCVKELCEEGWLKVKSSFVMDGEVVNMPCIYRTKKTLYSQIDLL